ncbi:MAG TPA: flotillin family protein, partial [Thermoanaerobaculia bacterium]|nr:flotillin family protein [Thermoanaerobaculia bacterium]
IKEAVEAYDVECIDTLIGDIVPPAELMKTQTDRKIADELRHTFEAQREAQMRRQELERETAVANLQAEVVRSEQQVRIAERQATANVESAKGEAGALRQRAEAEAAAVRMRAGAEAEATRIVGVARAESYKLGVEAVGAGGYTAMQLATTLSENKMKLVPDIAVGGSAGLGDVFLARFLQGQTLATGNGAPK